MPAADVLVYSDHGPQIVASDGLSVREDVLYSDAQGEESERSKKRAQEAIGKLREILPSVLEPKETIFYLLRCQAPVGALEQLTVGWSIYQITATTLVFTNLRVLHFGVDTKGRWKRTLRSVRWGDIAEARIKGWIGKMLALKYASGKKENYWRLRNKDAKKVAMLLTVMLPASRGETTAAREMVALCPDCRTQLTPGTYRCSSCGLTFKDEKTLLKRTLLIPGGGYLYAGVWVLGALSFLWEGSLTLLLIVEVLMAIGLLTPERNPSGAPMQRAAFWSAAGLIVVLLVLEKSLAFVHSRRIIRRFLPLKRPGQA